MRNELAATNWKESFLRSQGSVDELCSSFKSTIYDLQTRFIPKAGGA